MDFSILYHVFWRPREVFKQFVGKTRLEPFILVTVIVVLSGINAYVGLFEEIIKHPVLQIVGLVQSLLFLLLSPTVDATIIFLIVRFVLKKQSGFVSLVSAFILCGLPNYIETFLIVAFGYPAIGLDSFISLILSHENTQPFLLGMIGTITPFFIWVIILWRAAISQIFNLQRRQNVLLVCSLVLINMLLDGFWSQLKCLMAK